MGLMNHYYKKIQGWFNYEDLYRSVIKDLPDGAKMLEVGVWKGQSSAFAGVEIINSGKKITFYAVDTFKGSPEHRNKGGKFYDPITEAKDGLYNEFKKNTEPVKSVVKAIRKSSEDAFLSFSDESLDFVFIDGEHSEKAVLNDILRWSPRVKDGGILAGHDAHHQPVINALNQSGYSWQKTDKNCWIIPL